MIHVRLLGASLLLSLWGPVPAQTTSPSNPGAPARQAPANTAKAGKPVKDEKSGFSYLIEPAPAWVVPARERPSVPTDRAAMHYRVIDEQLRADDRGGENYNHVVRVVDDAGGLSAAAQIELEFDPAYQTLSLHHIDVVRAGVRSSRLDRRRIQLLQRETQLERRMVDGRVTLSLAVEDVRPGDEVDFAYTIRGSNPIFGKRYLHTTWMGSWRGPVATHQLRLLTPASRHIQARVEDPKIESTTTTQGAWQERIYRRESVPQVSAEEGTLGGELLATQLQFSEFADWAEVAKWGRELFADPGRQPLLARKAEDIRNKHATPAARVRAALDFVQKELRYFGTEIGVNSHLPASPDKVIEQRFGDCKDKVGVLVALLRELDVPAVPVLVSQYYRRDVERMLPSAQAFDHVIARVELDGQTLWLDATRAHQTGPAAARSVSSFLRGLPLEAGTSTLATLPPPWDSPKVTVKDRLRFARLAEAAKLESSITYHGDLAEAYREAFATRKREDLANILAETYVKAFPKIRSVAPFQVSSGEDDSVTITQQFEVPEFWRFPEQRMLVGDVALWALIQPLALPRMQTRRQALGIAWPGVYRHDVEMTFEEDVFRQPGSTRLDETIEPIAIQATVESSLNRASLRGQVRFSGDRIEAKDWERVSAKVASTAQRLVNTVNIFPISAAQHLELSTKVKQLDEAMRQGKVIALTRTQQEAHFKLLVLDAQIEGRRLSPPLLAQALHARGVQLDHVGQAAKGRSDFEKAVSLVPENVEYLNGAAENAIARGDMAQAQAYVDKVLTLSANDSSALMMLGRARYLQGDWPGAARAFEQLLKDREALQRGYPLLWWTLAQRQLGQAVQAAADRYAKADWPKQWPRPVLDYLFQQIDLDALLKAARAQQSAPEALAEAYFYVAESHAASGQAEQAKTHWRKVVEQGVVEFVEDSAARWQLAKQP